MTEVVWSQDIFSKGELSPLMYGRVTVDAYYNGLKTARNCITYPQGGVGKRFGTLYLNEIPTVTDYTQIFFESYQFADECVYLILVIPGSILIYLEGILIKTVDVSTSAAGPSPPPRTAITEPMIGLIDSTVIEDDLWLTCSAFRPQKLVRSAAAGNAIASATTTEITLTTPVTDGLILPATFEATLPTTSPQVLLNHVYFLRTTSTTTAEIYPTAPDAKAQTNRLSISAFGGGNVLIQNEWTLSWVIFTDSGAATDTDLPTFDFGAFDYSASTFAPAAKTGYGIVITVSPAMASAALAATFVGGSIAGNGGVARITATTQTTLTVNITQSFYDTATIPGREVFLGEPAWSDARGWPSKCSSFQNRSIFANSRSLPNGLWMSVTNGYEDFDGLQGLDDDAIFWYPSSGNVNVIRFIVPYRSLTIHTNSGIYSTPLTFEQAITPSTFSMTLQESTAANVVKPRALDNQIISIAGNDVHSMLWDGFNNAYTSNISSIANEHLVRDPIDEAAYIDSNRAGSRYMFIVNSDGDMTIFQTLVSENIAGFTPADFTQTYGTAKFRWNAGGEQGRCWFIVEREIAEATTSDLVDGHSTDTLTLTTAGTFVLGVVTAFKISATTSIPTSSPQLVDGTYYWGVATDATNIAVYTSYADAVAEDNHVTFSDEGVGASVTPWPLAAKFYLEELSFDVFTDCTYTYSGVAEDTFTGLARFNAQMVKAVGDGFGFEEEGNDSEITLTAHGEAVEATEVSIGFPITTTMIPLDMAVPGAMNYKGTSLTFPKHIRSANLMFNETIGGTVNEQPIQTLTLTQTIPGDPPLPQSGIMETTPMLGWGNDEDSITISHDEPFDIRLIGIFYRIEV
jgi:hypothetical protein